MVTWPRWTFRRKLSAALALVALAPLGGVSLAAFTIQRDALEKDSLERLDAVAGVQAARVGALLDSQLEAVRLVTSRTQLRSLLAERIDGGGGDGKTDEGSARMVEILEDVIRSGDLVHSVAVVASDGDPIRATRPGARAVTIPDDAVRRAGSTEVLLDVVMGEGGLPLAVHGGPLRLDGRFLGVAVVASSLRPLEALAADTTGLGDTGETLVAELEPDGGALFLTSLRFDRDAALKRRLDPGQTDLPMIRAVAGQREVFTDTVDYRGERAFAATRYLPSVNWGIVVKIDQSEALAPVRNLRNVLLATFAVAVSVVAALVFFVSRSFARRVKGLTSAASAVRHGDWDTRASIRGSDELADLAQAFNEMTARLADANRNLEQRVAERTAELAESIGRFRGAFDDAPVGMAITALDGTYLQVNRALCELLRRPPEQLVGRSWRDLTHPDDLDVSDEFVDEALRSGSTYRIEKRYVVDGGAPVWVLLSVSILEDAEGRPHQMLAHVQDITSRREAEEHLERSNEALEQFAYVASHDLQEPLRVVRGFVDLLDRRYADDLPAEAKEFISFAVDGVKRMQQLLSDLFELSRLQRSTLEVQAVDLDRVLIEVTTDLQVAISEAGATVEADDPPTVAADETLVRRVLQNLMANAVKFATPDRTPEVRVSAEQDGPMWRISVTDNGIGISPEDRERIFLMFQRLHAREEFEGTGMGLWIVRTCVERLGGTIGVEEAPGGGARFWFTVPAAATVPGPEDLVPEPRADEHAQASEGAPSGTSGPGRAGV